MIKKFELGVDTATIVVADVSLYTANGGALRDDNRSQTYGKFSVIPGKYKVSISIDGGFDDKKETIIDFPTGQGVVSDPGYMFSNEDDFWEKFLQKTDYCKTLPGYMNTGDDGLFEVVISLKKIS